MQTRIYRVIGIYDNSSVDKQNRYLHIHLLDNSLLPDFLLAKSKLQGKPNILYQWGKLEDLSNNQRKPVVNNKTALDYGQIGIGSVIKKFNDNYHFGGEGFIFAKQAFRITKGNKAMITNYNTNYWLLQITAFKGSFRTDKIKQASSRDNLINQILAVIENSHKDTMFITSFLASFEVDNFYVRSNGIFPEDAVDNKTLSFFANTEAIGGHLIGDSNNLGDQKMINYQQAQVKLNIKSPVDIEVINYVEQLGSIY